MLRHSWTLGTDQPVMRYHIAEERRENFTSREFLCICSWFIFPRSKSYRILVGKPNG